jgi:hypothetical protein
MVTMSLEEFQQTAQKLDPILSDAGRILVTRNGEPFFEVLPVRKSGIREFQEKINKIWEGCDRKWTPEGIVELIRESRE